MDIIAVDIGNSGIALGVFVKDELRETVHLDANDPQGLVKTIKSMRVMCGAQEFEARTVPVVVSSVNPQAREKLNAAVNEALDQEILLIGRDVGLDMKLAVENPESVGTDRLLTAMAAYAVVENAVVIADFGTATTIDCVDHYGIFLGGAIMPGLDVAAKSLNEHTVGLPHVTPQVPTGVYGTNTEMAIQYGIYYGAIGALQGIVEKYATQLKQWPQLVLTGGYAKLIKEKCEFADSYVPNLCLDGIFLAYRKWRESRDSDVQSEMKDLEQLLDEGSEE
ncbi:MAG: type III pantothenate kinase [Planctomycetes bacterium]|nr:type III pantothenate kinase [Planctomycetota bacterium]